MTCLPTVVSSNTGIAVHDQNSQSLWWTSSSGGAPKGQESRASAELLVQLLSPQTRTCACDPVFKWVNSTLREKIHSRMQQGQHCSYLSHRDLWNGTVSSSSLNKLQCLTGRIALAKRVDGVCLLHLLINQARKAIYRLSIKDGGKHWRVLGEWNQNTRHSQNISAAWYHPKSCSLYLTGFC